MLSLLPDSMTVRGVSGTSRVHQGVKGAPGVSHGVKGDVRGVQGGSEGVGGATMYPRGSRTAKEVSQGSREV